MLIVVNNRFTGHLPGAESYSRQLFNRLITSHPEHDFLFINDRPTQKATLQSANAKEFVAGDPPWSSIGMRLWQHFRLPLLLKKWNAGVLINCNGLTCQRTQVPQVLLLCGLPSDHAGPGSAYKKLWRRNLPAGLKGSAAVAVISKHYKQQLTDQYHTSEDNIQVIGAGPEELISPLTPEEKETIKARYSDSKEYFLCANPLHNGKQIITLLKAFSLFKKRMQSNMQLLLPEHASWMNSDWKKKISSFKYRGEVHILKGLPGEEMIRLTAASHAVLDISDAGNGLDIFQSLQCHVPSIVAESSKAAEWAVPAVLQADADDPAAIAAQMMILYKDEYLRIQLIEKGVKQLSKNNWEDAAERLWQTIAAAVNIV